MPRSVMPLTCTTPALPLPLPLCLFSSCLLSYGMAGLAVGSSGLCLSSLYLSATYHSLTLLPLHLLPISSIYNMVWTVSKLFNNNNKTKQALCLFWDFWGRLHAPCCLAPPLRAFPRVLHWVLTCFLSFFLCCHFCICACQRAR